MKKNFLLLSVCLLMGSYAFAQDSPYTGAEVAEGTYYLYQVESGKWLQPNMKVKDSWTTLAKLDDVGFDVQLIKKGDFEGYQIYCNFTNNGELNGSDEDRFYLDQAGRDLTDWIFEPVESDGNMYKIMVKAKTDAESASYIGADIYIGADADGELTDAPTYFTWQLVTREERIKVMVASVESTGEAADASFLIPWFDRGRNDNRSDLWTQTVVNSYGGSDALDGSNGYPVKEDWHRMSVNVYTTLTDLPIGTYNFTVQAYYRDTEIESTELRDRYVAGTENLVATYFAGTAEGTVMSIFEDGVSASADGYSYGVALDNDETEYIYVPNSMSDASTAMFNGAYVNDWIQASVTDGNLLIGIKKTETGEEHYRDWLIYKRFYLQYVSTTAADEDLTSLLVQLAELIETAGELPSTTALSEAIAAAEEAYNSAKSSSALLEAINVLQNMVDVIKGALTDINAFNATLALVGDDVDTTEAEEQYNAATSTDEFSTALTTLRYARRRAAADTCEDIFSGQPVAAGSFYLYNIGQKQFFCGGSDWGTHAALGFPGIEVTLVEGDASTNRYHIDTGLLNFASGDDYHYLNYRGYTDCQTGSPWMFVKVDGKENVYNIVQGDYTDVHIEWDPYASTDAGNNDETTVGTEERNLEADNLNAQWKLVTKKERLALLDEASIDNPVDATILIQSPNFNQREKASDKWTLSNASIWEYGSNHSDFAAESWDTSTCDITQNITGSDLPDGIYVASITGFYRNGSHEVQVDAAQLQNAYFFAGNDESYDVLLPNIMSENDMAPGEGTDVMSEDGTVYNYPYNIIQATNFFHSGLYRVHATVPKTSNDKNFPIGVYKDKQGEPEDWVVVDNFRLTYYGPDTTVEEVEELLTGIRSITEVTPTKVGNNKIYNLQGIQVQSTTQPGLYIKNGKKFVVK